MISSSAAQLNDNNLDFMDIVAGGGYTNDPIFGKFFEIHRENTGYLEKTTRFQNPADTPGFLSYFH
jgi:hypothetical protein